MAWVLVHVLAPLAVATYFAVAYRCGGGRRLWRDASLLAAAIGGIAFWYRDIVFYHDGPTSAAGILTIFCLPAVLIASVVVHALLRPGVPAALPVASAALFSSLSLLMGHWIS